MKLISKIAKKFYTDVKSKEMHAPHIGPLIPFNLYRAMCHDYTTDKEYPTQDGVFWKQYQGMTYANGVPMPIHKRIFANLVYLIGKKLSPKMVVTYRK